MSAGPDQLSPSDMASLMAERGPIHVHVGGTAIFDGEPPGLDQFIAHVEERLELIPRFRRRVRYLPGKVMRAEWEDDPGFDLRRHVRHLALPAPGNDAQLREMVGQVMSDPLDQTRPLWQLYLIERGPGRGFAAVSKTHHALVDGVSAVDVGAVILDPDPDGTDLGLSGVAWSPKERRRTEQVIAGRVDDARRRLLGLPGQAARRALDPSSTQAATQAAFSTARGFFDLARSSDPVRPTFLNEEIGRDRRVAFASTTLTAMKQAGADGGTGATVNDVVLAISTGALRQLFELRGESIPNEFAALVPMSIRKPGEELSLGNRITTLMVPLPLDEPDPVERLRKVHETTDRLKRSEAARAASLVIEASGWVPPTMSRVLGSVGDALGPTAGRVLPQRLPWNLVISNVPGPPMPVYLLGRPLRSIHPFVALSPQRRALSIGVISYNGGLHFGLVGDRDRLHDLDGLTEFIEEELAGLGAVASG
ncbi:MAG: wax ester/triacylglycerol synthase family O-acyltransferase [Solirubrobacterales bacterium]|nr:wax ester/triacylglycerol synthase family O-acyltransferase [Solirubrobacterales bacterium]